MKYKVYITASDKVLWALEHTSKAFDEHCPGVDVVVFGYSKPEFELPESFKFISMGIDRGVDYWAEDIYNAFLNIKDDFFIWSIEDYEFNKPLDFDMINAHCEKYIDEKTNWFGLSAGPSKRDHSVVEDCGEYQIIELSQNADYRVAVQFNIWNKTRALHYLKMSFESKTDVWKYRPGSPWHFELFCSEKARNDGYNIYAFNGKVPASYGDGVSVNR